jgi:hypothetical protein
MRLQGLIYAQAKENAQMEMGNQDPVAIGLLNEGPSLAGGLWADGHQGWRKVNKPNRI